MCGAHAPPFHSESPRPRDVALRPKSPRDVGHFRESEELLAFRSLCVTQFTSGHPSTVSMVVRRDALFSNQRIVLAVKNEQVCAKKRKHGSFHQFFLRTMGTLLAGAVLMAPLPY